jgi:hypothetical protein
MSDRTKGIVVTVFLVCVAIVGVGLRFKAMHLTNPEFIVAYWWFYAISIGLGLAIAGVLLVASKLTYSENQSDPIDTGAPSPR